MTDRIQRRMPKKNCWNCHGRGIVLNRQHPSAVAEKKICGCVRLRTVKKELADRIDEIQAAMME